MERNVKDKILDAALEVVADKTISGTRMHLVAEYAGMVQSNVHYYFKTKDDLLSALQDKVQNDFILFRKNAMKAKKDTLQEQLHVFFLQKMEMITQRPQYDYIELDFWVQSRCDGRIKDKSSRIFEKWREDIGKMLKKHMPDADKGKINLISTVVISMLEGAAIQYLLDEGCFNLEEYFELCEKMLAQYLA
ncbi:MAG: TetR/AcrR family transcriptional regulator [Clostridiaceae bacterium]|nr:TetR/AcrR family transcriptional regulator [Clostridiaceae bacterium]